ncbi:MAG: aspartate/glutamate racemase family protein [Deltaproteobacteria bacterium]|nr:aspartate/glutamate racemase family protein [Deltaproteobacteria bacterium]
MRTIGLIGGLSPESTVVYYQTLNHLVRARLGGLHSAPLVLYSVDFGHHVEMGQRSDWAGLSRELVAAAQAVERAGAACLLIGANTMHRWADDVAAAVTIPLIHLVDVTAAAIQARGCRQVGLLGTRYTMEDGFYRDRLRERYAIETLVPDATEQQFVHDSIYGELCHGTVTSATQQRYRELVERFQQQGADGVILGCTEIPHILRPEQSAVPLFDTVRIHCEAAVAWA